MPLLTFVTRRLLWKVEFFGAAFVFTVFLAVCWDQIYDLTGYSRTAAFSDQVEVESLKDCHSSPGPIVPLGTRLRFRNLSGALMLYLLPPPYRRLAPDVRTRAKQHVILLQKPLYSRNSP